MELNDILQHDDTFKYQLLSRMKQDCDYYLGCGNKSQKHLWAGVEKDQIQIMKSIWESFSTDKKPDWLAWDEILEYEKHMLVCFFNKEGML